MGRSAGEEIGYPLQCSWASFVAQLVKNLPTIRETWVRSLGWEDSPGEGKGYPLQYSGLEYSGHTESGLYGPWDRKESDPTERLSHSLTEGEERSFSFTDEVGIQKKKEWWSTVSRAAEKLGRMAHKKPLDLRIMSLLKIFRGADSVN